jgi:hypothetical protein
MQYVIADQLYGDVYEYTVNGYLDTTSYMYVCVYNAAKAMCDMCNIPFPGDTHEDVVELFEITVEDAHRIIENRVIPTGMARYKLLELIKVEERKTKGETE